MKTTQAQSRKLHDILIAFTLACLMSVIGANVCAADITISSGTTRTTAVNLISSDNLTVESLGILSLTNGNNAVYKNDGGVSAFINNAGTIYGYLTPFRTSGIIVSNNSTITAIVNSGSISGYNGIATSTGTIGSLSNTNLITGVGVGILNDDAGTIASLINNSSGLITGGDYGIYSTGNITGFANNSSAIITGGADGAYTSGIISALANSGSITGTTRSGIANIGGAITSLTNSSSGLISGGVYGVINAGTITSLANSGEIRGSVWGILSYGSINELTNSGSITGATASIYLGPPGATETLINRGIIDSSYIGIGNEGNIGTITNIGLITSEYGIDNSGTITTLNNSQGASSTALTYYGILPTNYNIIINSTSAFGKLSVIDASGATTFGIYSGSSLRNNTRYSGVLSGISSSNLVATSGTDGTSGYLWNLLLEAGSTSIWDLCFGACPSTANTQQSLAITAGALQPIFTLQNTVLANSFSYDCALFGLDGVCISAGGRNTAVQAANGLNNTSGLIIASYRLNKHNSRIGAYADQNLSVNNAGRTVTLGNNTPLIGFFGVWSERADGIGSEIKVSAAYGQKNTTITRGVVGSGVEASEAGSGSSTLSSQGAQVVAKYGFGITENTLISPYLGVRYTQNNMGGYTEGSSSSVTAPLTYSALNTNATTALAGVGASYRVIPAVTTFASAGVETDTNTANGTYTATNASIGTLAPINFNANPVRTRPTATIGAYYDLAKNQRLGVTGIYRQEPYQAVSTTTVMATFTVGL